MLTKLFGSNARVKVLKLFLLNENSRFFVREVARQLNLQVNAVRRELANLEEIGLLKTKANPATSKQAGRAFAVEAIKIKGKRIDVEPKDEDEEAGGKQDKKYYEVDRDFLLFNELKALIVKSQMTCEDDLAARLAKVGKIDFLALTGFFVGDAQSGVDLFIVGRVSKEKLLKAIKELEQELVREVNYVMMTPDDFAYRREVTDVFLYSILEGRRITLINELGIQ